MNATPDTSQAAPIEEYAGDPRAFDAAGAIAQARPLVIRGLVRDWPIVKLARQSDTAFAQRLAELDSGADVDILMVAPEAEGVIGYTPDLGDFNFKHFKVPLTLGLQRLASYSRREHAPGLVIQSAPIRKCLPGWLADHGLPCLDPRVQSHRDAHAFRFAAQHRLRGMRRAPFHPVSAGTASQPLRGAAGLRAHRRGDQHGPAGPAGRPALSAPAARAGRGAGSRIAARRCDLHPAVVVASRRIARTAQRAGELLVEPGGCSGLHHRPSARRGGTCWTTTCSATRIPRATFRNRAAACSAR